MSSRSMQQYLERRVGRPQLSRLFALLQDGLGIPRASEEVLAAMKMDAKLELTVADVDPISPLLPVLKEPYVALIPGALDELEKSLDELKQGSHRSGGT